VVIKLFSGTPKHLNNLTISHRWLEFKGILNTM